MRTLPARDGAIAAAIAFTARRPHARRGRDRSAGHVLGRGHRPVNRTLRFTQPVWWTGTSPDGKLLAVQTAPADGAENRFELVRIATGKVLQSHALPYGPSGVAFTRDGRELVALGCCCYRLRLER